MDNPIALLQKLAIINRGIYQSKQVAEQRKSDRAQEATVKILSYDSSTGQFKVMDAAGKILSARAIFNSGALEIGSQVSMVTPTGGIPIIDAMPH